MALSDQVNDARSELEQIARRWVEAGWQQGDAGAVRAMYTPDFVDLSNPYAERGDRDDNVRGISELYSAFPDFHAEIDELIIDVERAKIAVRWSATGTHQGLFLGVPASGRRVLFRGIETLHIRNGLIVERSGEWDGIDIYRQLNAE